MVSQYIVYSMYKVEISCERFHYDLRKPIKSWEIIPRVDVDSDLKPCCWHAGSNGIYILLTPVQCWNVYVDFSYYADSMFLFFVYKTFSYNMLLQMIIPA